MSKYDLAQYLVNLHTLLDAQSKGATAVPSTTLAKEYERNWGLLKQEIAKDETGNREQHAERSETGADQSLRGPVRRG